MWGKSAIALVFWLATVFGVTKLLHTVSLSSSKTDHFCIKKLMQCC